MSAAEPYLVVVVGDSLSLPRAFDGIPWARTYPYLVADALRRDGVNAHVAASAKGGARLRELLKSFESVSRYLGAAPRAVGLVQVGIVDGSPRPLPFWARRTLGVLPPFIGSKIVSFLHRHRMGIMKAGFSFRFTRPKRFESEYTRLLELVRANVPRVFCINICPPGAANAARSPGLQESIQAYNRIINACAARVRGCEVLDVWTPFQELDAAGGEHVSKADGHHLTADGHSWIARQVLTRIHATPPIEKEKVYS